MRRCLLAPFCAAGFLIMGAVGSYAADFPQTPPPPAYWSPAPVNQWTGFYVGANLGYGWVDVGASGFSNTLEGVIGGGQIGVNWQIDSLVLGIEGDFQGTDENRSDTFSISGIDYTVDQDIPWFATLRGRIGYAVGPWLFYFTGGGAWQNYKLSVSALGTSVSDNTTKPAWTIGGGLEWMFAPQWSTQFEYLYMDTSDTSVTLFGTTFTGQAKNNIIRMGVNYHF